MLLCNYSSTISYLCLYDVTHKFVESEIRSQVLFASQKAPRPRLLRLSSSAVGYSLLTSRLQSGFLILYPYQRRHTKNTAEAVFFVCCGWGEIRRLHRQVLFDLISLEYELIR